MSLAAHTALRVAGGAFVRTAVLTRTRPELKFHLFDTDYMREGLYVTAVTSN